MLCAERESEMRIKELQERLRYSHEISERLQDVEYECETLREEKIARNEHYDTLKRLRGELVTSREEMSARHEELFCATQKLRTAETKLESASDRILTLSCDLRDAKQRLVRAQSRKDTALREASRVVEGALRNSRRQSSQKSGMSSMDVTRLCLHEDTSNKHRKRMKFTQEQENYVISLERTIRELRQERGSAAVVNEHTRVLKENARLKKMLKTNGGDDDVMRLKYELLATRKAWARDKIALRRLRSRSMTSSSSTSTMPLSTMNNFDTSTMTSSASSEIVKASSPIYHRTRRLYGETERNLSDLFSVS